MIYIQTKFLRVSVVISSTSNKSFIILKIEFKNGLKVHKWPKSTKVFIVDIRIKITEQTLEKI